MKYSIRRQLPSPMPEDQRRLRELVRKINEPGGLSTPRSLWFFAEVEGQERGCAYVVVFDDFVTVDYLFVDPECRGRKIGRTLVEDITDYAQSRNATRVLTSTIGGQNSLSFWEKCGFRILGLSAGRDPKHDVAYLEKRL